MMKCQNCGTETDQNICPGCGQAVQASAHCPQCGSVMTNKFCGNCGYAAQQSAPGTPPAAYTAAPQGQPMYGAAPQGQPAYTAAPQGQPMYGGMAQTPPAPQAQPVYGMAPAYGAATMTAQKKPKKKKAIVLAAVAAVLVVALLLLFLLGFKSATSGNKFNSVMLGNGFEVESYNYMFSDLEYIDQFYVVEAYDADYHRIYDVNAGYVKLASSKQAKQAYEHYETLLKASGGLGVMGMQIKEKVGLNYKGISASTASSYYTQYVALMRVSDVLIVITGEDGDLDMMRKLCAEFGFSGLL